ncbi:hypothetical protein AWB76_03271 [Caballeronia temeraria]|uniref:Portal protein n=1 Tax=Caballeronia temeraria TaxID=1777137 RepID=A0A158AZY2_9BURK|nr:hypothetical protein [Caballeronia temeraria]SAK62577.1 hypothetical protein AWB76_03271 [Caballeronia temeraria]
MSVSLIGMKAKPGRELPPPGARFPDVVEEQASAPIADLAAYVRECFDANQRHRQSSGIEEVILQCTRQRNGEYDPDDKAKMGNVDVFINVTGLKCRAAESWLKDVLVNVEAQPWTISATPIPELSADLISQVEQLVRAEIVARGYASPSLDSARARELKKSALDAMQQLAADACSRMSDKINDQLTEANWKAVFEQWQSDIVTYPAGIIKGPVVRTRRALRWIGNELIPDSEAALAVERVAPIDFYPSAEATNPQDANSVIERMRMTKAKLYECIGLPHFDEATIRLCIAEFEFGFRDWLSSDAAVARDEKKDGALWGDSETIDVLDFWGRVQGSKLMEWGVRVDDPEAQYEANVWLVGDYAIRALLNPDPLGRRPYHKTSFNRLPGQFWGEGVPQMIRDIQRSANGAARSLLRNMAYASGPMVEVDIDRMDDSEDDPEKIVPWKVYFVKPSSAPGGSSAVRYVVAPSIAGDLMSIFNRFLQLSDDYSGIPAYTYGNPQVGGAGATMGGLSLLYGGALKGIKSAIMNIDRDGIEPLITQMWTFNMLFDPDMSLKADAKVVANGAEGILQREQGQARSIETLRTITPYVQGGAIPPQAVQDILRQWLSGQGFDVSHWFPNSGIDSEIAAAMGAQTAVNAAPQPGPVPGTPPPALDGRQASVLQVQQQSQIPAPPGAASF